MKFATIIGRRTEPEITEDALLAARIGAARSAQGWQELEAVDLVSRGPFLVSAETDAVFTPYRGVVYQTGSASVIATHTRLHFYVDVDGLHFLEAGTETWSEIFARRERHRLRVAR